jgi:hypothetical protein
MATSHHDQHWQGEYFGPDGALTKSRQCFELAPNTDTAWALASTLYGAAGNLASRGRGIKKIWFRLLALYYLWQALRLCRCHRPADLYDLTADQLDVWATIERRWLTAPFPLKFFWWPRAIQNASNCLQIGLYKQSASSGTRMLLLMGLCELQILKTDIADSDVDRYYRSALKIAETLNDDEKLVRFERFAMRVRAQQSLREKAYTHLSKALDIALEHNWRDQVDKIKSDAKKVGLNPDL